MIETTLEISKAIEAVDLGFTTSKAVGEKIGITRSNARMRLVRAEQLGLVRGKMVKSPVGGRIKTYWRTSTDYKVKWIWEYPKYPSLDLALSLPAPRVAA